MKDLETIKKSVPFVKVIVPGILWATELSVAGQKGSVVFSPDEGGWQHVSFSPYSGKLPTWDAMCELKDIFFDDEEEAIQLHPKKSQYVNVKENCLHLWAREDLILPQ